MAKNSSGSKNPSRIRFIMVDAELGDGDVSQITQAITNALRPPVTNMSMKRIAASVQPNVDQNSDATDVEVVEAELEEIEALKPIASKPKTQRKVGVKPNLLTSTSTAILRVYAGKTKKQPQTLSRHNTLVT
jgi:hypothetical protein